MVALVLLMFGYEAQAVYSGQAALVCLEVGGTPAPG